MADNYLEKQREQYEARKAAWLQAQKYGKKKTTNHTKITSTGKPAQEKESKEESAGE